MKAMRPAVVVAAIFLSFALVPVLAGCGDFWQNPNGTSTGTTASTTTLTTSPQTTTTTGTSVVLTAAVTPTAATGKVTFYNNNTSIGTGTLTSGTATYTTSFTSAGTASLTATYGGNSTYADSTSSVVDLTVTAASADSVSTEAFNRAIRNPTSFDGVNANRATNLVLDPAGTWTVPATSYVGNLAGLAIDGDVIRNVDGEGHCVYYSGSLYPASGTTDPEAKGVYALSRGGYLAPFGTEGLDCE